MKIFALFLFAAMLIAQAMPVTLVGGASAECPVGCCPKGKCDCCVVHEDTKLPAPVAPTSNVMPLPKEVPFVTSVLPKGDMELATTARVVWRAHVELCSAGEIPFSVLHCSFLI